MNNLAGQILAHAFHDELEKIALSPALKARAAKAAKARVSVLKAAPQDAGTTTALARREGQLKSFEAGTHQARAIPTAQVASARGTKATEAGLGITHAKPKKTFLQKVERGADKAIKSDLAIPAAVGATGLAAGTVGGSLLTR